jgi:polar amino acid transport system substrate-binding protein
MSNSSLNRWSTRGLAGLGIAVLLAVSACGGDGGGESSTDLDRGSVSDQAPLYESVPQHIRDKGQIVLGSSIAYPPYEYFDEDGELKGFEPELSDAVAEQLGVPFTWKDAGYDTLFSGLGSKRYDILWVGTNDTPERQERFDFVDYMKSASGLVVKPGNPEEITAAEDMCGKTIAVARGSLQETYLDSLECSGSPVDVLSLNGDTEAQLQVKQGRAAGLLTNYPSGAYYADASDGTLEIVSSLSLLPSYYGILVRKEDSELRDVLQEAVQNVIESGEYAEILERWDLSELAIDEALVNGGN